MNIIIQLGKLLVQAVDVLYCFMRCFWHYNFELSGLLALSVCLQAAAANRLAAGYQLSVKGLISLVLLGQLSDWRPVTARLGWSLARL